MMHDFLSDVVHLLRRVRDAVLHFDFSLRVGLFLLERFEANEHRMTALGASIPHLVGDSLHLPDKLHLRGSIAVTADMFDALSSRHASAGSSLRAFLSFQDKMRLRLGASERMRTRQNIPRITIYVKDFMMLKGIVSFRRLLTMAGSLITFELLFLAYLPSETA